MDVDIEEDESPWGATERETQEQEDNVYEEEEADVEDPVIQEIPVYLTDELIDQLHLLQFPAKPAHVPILGDNIENEERVVDIKFEPANGKFRITTEIDTKSEFYDKSKNLDDIRKGRSSGNADTDFIAEDDEEFDKRQASKIDKHVYESTSSSRLSESQNYAIGLYDGHALHLTPLKSMLEMRTNLPYLDKVESEVSGEPPSKKPELSVADKAGKAMPSSTPEVVEVDEPVGATKIQVKFKSMHYESTAPFSDGGKRKIGTKGGWHSSFRKKEELTPWVNLEYAGLDEDVFQKLQLNRDESNENLFDGVDNTTNLRTSEYASAVASKDASSAKKA